MSHTNDFVFLEVLVDVESPISRHQSNVKNKWDKVQLIRQTFHTVCATCNVELLYKLHYSSIL